MKSSPSGSSDLEQMIGSAAVEVARISIQAAKKILGELPGDIAMEKSQDHPPIDLMDMKDELVALVSLPGMSKDMIDLRVTEDTLTISAKAAAREGKYLRHEIENRNLEREIKLPVEVKPEQVKASFNEGILEIHLPKLVVIDSQRIRVE